MVLRRPKRRHVARYLVVAAALLGVLTVAPLVDGAVDLYQARAAFGAGVAAAAKFDVAAAKAHFARGGRLAASADRKLSLPQMRPAKLIPIVGDNLRAASALAKGASLLGPASEEALNAAEVFPTGPSGPKLGFAGGRIDTAPWQQAATRLAKAAADTRAASEVATGARGWLLPPLESARDQFVEQAGAAARSLERGSDGSALVAHFFGADRRRRWMILLQNPVEARATGGFLGAFGILTAEAGQLNLERFDNNNNFPSLSRPAPAPREFARNYDRFYARTTWVNTNMSPDFPTVAQVLTNMWEEGTDETIDGVIAIDAVALNELLRLVGPVIAPPVGEINADNFLRIALNEAYIRFPEKEARSSFLLEVGREAWTRLALGNFPEAQALIEPMGRMVEQKRVQIWSRDEAKRIQRLGLGGELRPKEGSDFLMLVSQNAAANKVDYYAKRRISYKVDLTDSRVVRSLVEVTIQNDAPSSGLPTYILGPNAVGPNNPPYAPGLNRTFTTVYRPRSSAIIGSFVDGKEAGGESRSEKGLMATSHFLEVPAGRSGTLSLETTGVPVRPGLYRLVVQHQPHLSPDRLDLEITMPANARITRVTKGMKIEGNLVRWSGDLDTEKEFLVRYGPPRSQL